LEHPRGEQPATVIEITTDDNSRGKILGLSVIAMVLIMLVAVGNRNRILRLTQPSGSGAAQAESDPDAESAGEDTVSPTEPPE
jgi:hypothetical protein